MFSPLPGQVWSGLSERKRLYSLIKLGEGSQMFMVSQQSTVTWLYSFYEFKVSFYKETFRTINTDCDSEELLQISPMSPAVW